MSIFLRQLYKIKPQAWGPPSAVQSSIFANAERAGIDPGSIAAYYPFWSMAGLLFRDYSNTQAHMQIYNLQTTYSKWSKNMGYLYAVYGGPDDDYALATKQIKNIKHTDVANEFCYLSVYPSAIHWANIVSGVLRAEILNDGRINVGYNGLNGYAFTHTTGSGYYTTDERIEFYIYAEKTPVKHIRIFLYTESTGLTEVVPTSGIVSYIGEGTLPDQFYPGVSRQTSFTNYYNYHGRVDAYISALNINFNENVIYALHDNPYFLLHRQPSVVYSVPGGGGTVYSVVCSDGFTFADTTTKTAILQAAAVESINLSDSDENVAQFIASLVDSFTVADLTTKTATYPVSVLDAFFISDTTTALQKVIALISDNVTFSAVSIVRADLTGIASDNVQFSETLISTLHAQAIASEIINLSGTPSSRADLAAQATDNFTVSAATTADALGVLIGLCSDTFNVSDTATSRADLLAAVTDALGLSDVASALLAAQAQAADSFTLDDSATWANIAQALVADGFTITGEVTCRADLVAALVDSMTISDTAAAILTAYATATDGFTVSDTAFWAGVTQAIASDSFTVSGSVTGLIKILAQAAETINFNDSGSVIATYNVQVNDAVEFATAISTIAQLRAAVADGFNVTATAMEVSQLPNGKVSVSFSTKVPGVDFSMKTATIIFNIK